MGGTSWTSFELCKLSLKRQLKPSMCVRIFVKSIYTFLRLFVYNY